MLRSLLGRLLGTAAILAVIWGCSEVLAPNARRFTGPAGKQIDPRCCPNGSGSGCGCPGTIFGSSNGTGDTAGVALYVERNLICPAGLGTPDSGSGGAPLLSGEPWPDSVTVYVAVDSGGEGNHLLDREIVVSVESVDSAGTSSDAPYGHAHFGHGGVQKPKGVLSADTVNTGQQGLVILTYRAGTVSGPIVIRATSTGASKNELTLGVGVPGLVALPGRPSYVLVGQLWSHPANHHGIPAVTARLDTLADSVMGRFNRPLYLNDMALPLGGRFDLDSNWACCHDEHRAGRDTDLRTNNAGGLSARERQYVWAQWERMGGTVHDETVLRSGAPNTRSPHYHLRYRRPE